MLLHRLFKFGGVSSPTGLARMDFRVGFDGAVGFLLLMLPTFCFVFGFGFIDLSCAFLPGDDSTAGPSGEPDGFSRNDFSS